ncbi:MULTISPECIES: hypothetical protein [unclassified Tatumella]|uniref:hypothetical protein n=1 Tax=unclassified Tatumella TaxID=2649542 RepID=UPI001BB0B05E|nr:MULTISPECIES: hypothetical protein [unclassified Tatumella]MBS0877786.1 hypothetical protein [Tatumella sp. JGM82]MBS0891425.1 hypothetical protein [Tatumella sp. JGM94]MBS0902421.1 hypothetical protein [Tatumella sp. JGM100]
MDRQYNNGLTAEQRLSATVQSLFTAEAPATITEAARVLIAGPQAYCWQHAVNTLYRATTEGRQSNLVPEDFLSSCEVA